ncbi:MAG: type II toxin-antitoxin system VapB family antitoxin [Alphaproteobacteria bacterium]|nr:type II toxin-antitoxin system VapB family antitoxin [Alphaproteobacteria bacterium]
MTLSIKDQGVDRMVREVAKNMKGTMTEAVAEAVRERLLRDEKKNARRREMVIQEALAIARQCASGPVYDNRTPDEILGYDEHGLPT